MRTRHDRGASRAAGEGILWAAAQLLLLAVLWGEVGLGVAGWVAGIAYTLGAGAILTAASRRTPGWTPRPADRVTLARTVLVGGVTALVADRLVDGAPGTVLVALATLALVLDAVDGVVARCTGTSRHGARFDMEVDAFLILVLGVQVAASLGLWVLLIAAMRYLFVAAGWVLPWLRAELPASLARKTVAAIQGVVLVVASSGVLPRTIETVVVGLALALLVWSFARDTRWLCRRQRGPGG